MRLRRTLIALATFLAMAGIRSRWDHIDAQTRPITFDAVAGMFPPNCDFCHGWDEQATRSGLFMGTYQGLMEGAFHQGAFRRVIIPGDAEHSPLIEYVEGRRKPRMPFGRDPLSRGEIQLLRRWIDDGARPDPRAAAEHSIVVNDIPVTEGQASFWLSCRAPKNEQAISLRVKVADQSTGQVLAYEWPKAEIDLNGRWSQWQIKIPSGSMKLPGRVSAELSVATFMHGHDDDDLNGVIFLVEPKRTPDDELLKQKDLRTVPTPPTPPYNSIRFTYILRAASDVALSVQPDRASQIVFRRSDRDLPANKLLSTTWNLGADPAVKGGWYFARMACTSRDPGVFQPDMAILFKVVR